MLDEQDNQFHRRSYIRSSMAATEGIVWLLKQICLQAALEAKAKLSVAEFAILTEKTYELKSNGKVKTQTKFLKLPNNLRFVISMCNRFFGTNVDLEVGTTSWQDFQDAIAIRNRITHPKNVHELEINDGEIATYKRFVGWFNLKIHHFVDTISVQSGADLADYIEARTE